MTCLLPSRSLLFVGLIAAVLGLVVPRTSPAQVWERTVRLSVPRQIDGPMEALLDTLVHTLERREGAAVRRRPNDSTQKSVSALQNALIDEYGIGILTANTLFVDYRFEVGAYGQLERDVTGLHFLFRPGPMQEDIPLLYVDAQQAWVQKLLHNKGTALPTNEASLIPFRRHLGFLLMARSPDTQVVEIDGEPVREGFSVKKEALIRQILYLTYEL